MDMLLLLFLSLSYGEEFCSGKRCAGHNQPSMDLREHFGELPLDNSLISPFSFDEGQRIRTSVLATFSPDEHRIWPANFTLAHRGTSTSIADGVRCLRSGIGHIWDLKS